MDEQRSIWIRGTELLRRGGARQLWFRILGELGYRRQLVTELRLPAAERSPAPDVEGRFLGTHELRDYAGLHGTTDEARARLARGERCFGVWLEGRLVSTTWFATGTIRLGYLERKVDLRPGKIYIYEIYTKPGYRGRGISGAGGALFTRSSPRRGFAGSSACSSPRTERESGQTRRAATASSDGSAT